MESRNAMARESPDRRELTGDQHLAVGLHRDSVHLAVDAQAGIKGEVHIARGSVGVERECAQVQQEACGENERTDPV